MAASTSTEVTLVTPRLSKSAFMTTWCTAGGTVGSPAPPHSSTRALGVQPSRSFFLPAWYSGLLPPCWAPVRKAGWNSASRAWSGVPPGRLPDVIRVVVGQRGVGQQVFDVAGVGALKASDGLP